MLAFIMYKKCVNELQPSTVSLMGDHPYPILKFTLIVDPGALFVVAIASGWLFLTVTFTCVDIMPPSGLCTGLQTYQEIE